jgi:hypothetical protein
MDLSQRLFAVDLRWMWAIVLVAVAVGLTLLVRRLHGGKLPRS